MIATVANLHKARWCFVVWFVTNLMWVVVDFNAGIYPQAGKELVYTGFAVWGWVKWGKERPE
jgi:nicotinamide riboside transporter PnuC